MVLVSEKKTQSAESGTPMPLEPPSPEISPLRVLVLIVVIVGCGLGVWRLTSDGNPAAAAKSDATPVFAPYVDVTQTPTYPFQLPTANSVSGVFLAFVVSDPSDPCAPSWGSYYNLDEAEQSLDLDARTAQLRAQGGEVMVSYGGRDNTELAVGCTNVDKLTEAYMAPIERYDAGAIDLDLEGEALADMGASARRAAAIAKVQRRLGDRREPLRVWVTLPVSSEGLTAEGIAAVRTMLEADVKLTGVNAMTMDFGPGQGADQDMIGTVERALGATRAQVQSLWREAGLPADAASTWGSLGATVMIGVNDVPGERFTTDDARELVAFSNRHGIPRVSAWSLNRDSECGGAFARTGVLSNTCSGVLQKPLEFTRIFSELKGTKTARPQAETESTPRGRARANVADDPARSPYPIWRPTAAYYSGYKVVWQGNIYEASWWNQGTPPDSLGAGPPSGPWQPIGPVPAGSRAPELVPLVSGTFPDWSPTTVYLSGDRVSFEGLPFQARWYTKGEQPIAQLPTDSSAPWEPLFKHPGEPVDLSSEAGVE